MARTPSERPADLEADVNAQIDRELDIAKARWGETFELKCLEGSRGDTLSDEKLLRALRYFNEHGTIYSRIIASTELPENERASGYPTRAHRRAISPSSRSANTRA